MIAKIISIVMSIWLFICSLLGINIGKGGRSEMIEYSNDKKSVFITLDENGSTGYMWEYEISDPDVLTLKSTRYIQTANDNIEGAPGIREFEFTALKEGTATITLEYDRSWENDPIQTIVIKITVASDLTIDASVLSDTSK